VIFVALAVVVATAFGVVCEVRLERAPVASRGALRLMLYVLVPFVSFVNVAHLRLTVGAGAGLVFAYLAIGTAGLAAWAAGRWALRLPGPTLGALICSVILVNTGYLGLPMTVALLGAKDLSSAVAYDQVVSGPMLFVVGFGVGAAFGAQSGDSGPTRLRAFLTRNPPLLAVIAGLIAPASAAPALLVHISHLVVAALLPLGFFAVGVNLSAERREDAASLVELPDRSVVLAVGLRLLVAPLLLAAVSSTLVRLPAPYLLQAAMPAAISSLIVGQAYGLDQRLTATVIVWSTATVLVIGLGIAAA
jgi:malate permease and related proteins